jgi:hypothetical protein
MNTLFEAAAEEGMSHWTFRRYLRRGVMKAHRINGQLYLERKEQAKARRHFEQHGGPGGRPLLARA